MDVEEALDRLYAAPLEQFTATRNSLAKELSGREGADLKTLRKPNLAAWALNQLSRRHRKEIDELFAATDEVRRAQRRLMSGGKASALREATHERGRIVSQLTKMAGEILTEAGHSAAQTTLTAISDSLVAVANDAEAADLLRKGRLTRELRAESGLGVGGLTLVGAEAEPEEEEEPADSRQAVMAAREAVNEARERVREARKAAQEAEAEVADRVREADEAERGAKAAREAAEFARRAAEARRNEADEAARALDEAQTALKEAERE